MYEIKKILIWPFARSVAVLFTASMLLIPVGFVFFISVFGSVTYGGGFELEDFFEVLFDEDFLVGYLIAIPITAGISLAAGAFGAWIYNLMAEKIGGIMLGIDYHQENQNINPQPTQENSGTQNNQN